MAPENVRLGAFRISLANSPGRMTVSPQSVIIRNGLFGQSVLAFCSRLFDEVRCNSCKNANEMVSGFYTRQSGQMVFPYSRIGTGEQLRRVDERKMLEAVSERRPQISGHSCNNCYEEVCHRFGEMKNVVREDAIS